MDITSSYLSSDFTQKFTPGPFLILVLWKVWLCDHQVDAPGRPPRAESMTGQGPLLCIEIHHCAGPEVSPSMGCPLPMPNCSRDTQAAHSLHTLDSFVSQFRLRYSQWLKHSGLWCFQPNCSTCLSLFGLIQQNTVAQVGYKQEKCTSYGFRGWSPRPGCWHAWLRALFRDTDILSCLLKAEGGEGSLWSLCLTTALIPFRRAPPSTCGCCSSVTKSCPTLCDPMDCSTWGFPVLHYLQEFAQTHVHWFRDATSSSVALFSSCLQSFPASGSFQMNWPFTSRGPSFGASASASVLPMNIQDWLPLGLTGLISLLFKGLSRILGTSQRSHLLVS